MSDKGLKRLVLVGGGHSHLAVLKRIEEFTALGVEITLITPGSYHYYSGMGPGMLSGQYQPEDCRVDLKALAKANSINYVEDKFIRVDAKNHTILLKGGDKVDYDIASFNTGSRVPSEAIPGAKEKAIKVKPIERLLEVKEAFIAHEGEEPFCVLVVGGGPAGVEIAGNLDALAKKVKKEIAITILEGGNDILAKMPRRAVKIARASLCVRGIKIETNFRISAVYDNVIRSIDGSDKVFDAAILATGIVPHDLFGKSGMTTGGDGGMVVNYSLQSVDDPDIFGGGDCISLEHHPLPRVGVYAVRQGPVLADNLKAYIQGKKLRIFHPQRLYLLIINLGDETGLLVWGNTVLHGGWAVRLKNYLDTSFMKRFGYKTSPL